ncbi:ferredoxin [Nocardia sp. NPDC051832]|uniref:ferredoxin n=1 Tax=Nocardia sp. NPDC051832 TaxID=3155673 RepID=UPI003448B102
MRITVDRARCIGAGMCALTAAAVFDQDAEEGKVIPLTDTPGPGVRDAVREAALICPSGAITLR